MELLPPIQCEAEGRWRNGASARRPSRFDFVRLMSGSSVELVIGSDTLGAVARQDADRRCPVWRSRKKSNLGWVPVNCLHPGEVVSANRYSEREITLGDPVTTTVRGHLASPEFALVGWLDLFGRRDFRQDPPPILFTK